MSGKFIMTKDRTRYRFNLVDDKGVVVFKGAFASSKEKLSRNVNLMMSMGEDVINHLQIMKSVEGKYTVRGEEHSSREGEKGRAGDALPLGFSEVFATEAEAKEMREKIAKAAIGASLVDEAGN